MDLKKSQALKAQLGSQEEPPVVDIAKFFDGNDDLGSIGCNLDPHPGIDAFRESLTGLLKRADIVAVYAQISELDPGDDCWPFADTVLVVGKISVKELRRALRLLSPDEVGTAEEMGVSSTIADAHGSPVMVAWWD
ncbi:MAG: hypothetical protein FD180_1957 [Planctomycetota bacterium]|nr:MAG: hypothetical protein FD180_1957 [Planctomycetota bacterium]